MTASRSAWQRVLALDPQNPEANAALGRVALDGAWVSADDAYRARGFVQYEGRWVTPAEHEAGLRERAAEQAAEQQAREANLRVREAEARAQEAEARAQEAAYGSEAQSEGLPYLPYGYGYGVGYGLGYGMGYGNGYRPGYGPGHGNGGRPSHPIAPPPGMGHGRPGPRPSLGVRPTPPRPTTTPSASKPAGHRTAAIVAPSR